VNGLITGILFLVRANGRRCLSRNVIRLIRIVCRSNALTEADGGARRLFMWSKVRIGNLTAELANTVGHAENQHAGGERCGRPVSKRRSVPKQHDVWPSLVQSVCLVLFTLRTVGVVLAAVAAAVVSSGPAGVAAAAVSGVALISAATGGWRRVAVSAVASAGRAGVKTDGIATRLSLTPLAAHSRPNKQQRILLGSRRLDSVNCGASTHGDCSFLFKRRITATNATSATAATATIVTPAQVLPPNSASAPIARMTANGSCAKIVLTGVTV